MDNSKKELIRRGYNFRLLNIVNGNHYKKFGVHENCKCKIENMVDKCLNEEVLVARVCEYCEWASCRDCKLIGMVNISCDNESHNT